MHSRLDKAIKGLVNNGLDGFLISSKYNIRYLTGFPGEDAYLLISKDNEPVYFTDFRYIEDAKKSIKNCKIEEIKGNFAKVISNRILGFQLHKVGFEGRILPFDEFTIFHENLPGVELESVANFIENFRQIKDKNELILIKKAVDIAVDVFSGFKKSKLDGLTEKQIADKIENRLRQLGGKSSSFEIIVASDYNASYPHARSTDRRICKDSLVLIDAGVAFKDYNSDLTRTLFLGKIKTSEVKKIFDIVLEAKSLAINEIRPGVPISEIDAAARNFITKNGYGDCFRHSLGHGIGLEVHEAPGINRNNKNLLEEGMVFTIEPAIYLPGKFGVRLEDMVQVTKKGVKVLNGKLFDK